MRAPALAAATLVVMTLQADGAGRQAPTPVDDLVARAAAYVAEYERQFSSVVAEERYDQRLRILEYGAPAGVIGSLRGSSSAYERRRKLVSDYLLVKVPGLEGWTPFRDVIEVDGRAVRDRDERLSQLFIESPARALDQALRIAEESSRFNLGDVRRTVNVPTLALLFLVDRHRPRVAFHLGDDQTIEGIGATGLAYVDQTHPTLIRGSGDNDIVADGTIWIDPVDGRVLQTRVHTNSGTLESEIVVSYRLDERLGLWVPWRMRESYKSALEQIDATAIYTNFRRFRIETDEVIKK
jgi:hypothetical protein